MSSSQASKSRPKFAASQSLLERFKNLRLNQNKRGGRYSTISSPVIHELLKKILYPRLAVQNWSESMLFVTNICFGNKQQFFLPGNESDFYFTILTH